MIYRNYKKSDIEKVVNLLNICFPKNNITKHSFLWKHFDNYFENKTVAMVADDKGKICSFVCFVPINITNKKNNQNIYSCAVQATHPNNRRQGIVSKLTKKIENHLGSKISYIGFSNENGIKIDKFSKRINYKILGNMEIRYVLCLPYVTDVKLRKVKSILSKNNFKSDYFNILKDNRYLKWRYINHSKFKYDFFEVNMNKITIGYIACKYKNIKYPIIDLFLMDDDVNLYKKVIKSFASFSFFHGKLLISYSYLKNNFWSKSAPLISINKKRSVYFTIKTRESSLENINNWIIANGDIQ